MDGRWGWVGIASSHRPEVGSTTPKYQMDHTEQRLQVSSHLDATGRWDFRGQWLQTVACWVGKDPGVHIDLHRNPECHEG